MASATVTLGFSKTAQVDNVDIVIIGGGICGIMAAKKAQERGLKYVVIERTHALGGVWHTMANATSFLQAFEPNYRFDANYRLNQDPLTKNTSHDILVKLNEYAKDYGIPAHTLFKHEAVSVFEDKGGNYRTVVRNLTTNTERHFVSGFLCICCGILSTQWTAEERGVKDLDTFKGVMTYAGRHNGQDSLVASTNLVGKRVVIMGSGSFASEAMEAAERAGAEHITIVSRPRYRWIVPFSRQYTFTSLVSNPFLPWAFKTRFALRVLRHSFYNACGLQHWAPPTDELDKVDFSGQCNDGYFRLSYSGKLTCKLGSVDRLETNAVVLKSGEKLHADMFVIASGCKYNLEPEFLKTIGLGFKDIHNFAFVGKNPRIGVACDFVLAYVPWGPLKQLELFYHSIDCCRRGLEKQLADSLFHTPLPNHGDGMHKGGRMAGHYTFFEPNHCWDSLSKAQAIRAKAMFDTLDVGKGVVGRLGVRVSALYDSWKTWVGTSVLAVLEWWRYPVFGRGVGDHHYTFQHAVLHANAGCAPLVDTLHPPAPASASTSAPAATATKKTS